MFRSTLGDNGVEEVCACLETVFCNTRQSNARSWHLSILSKGSFTKVSPARKDNPRTSCDSRHTQLAYTSFQPPFLCSNQSPDRIEKGKKTA